jgi:hypothetical protein
MNLMGNLAGTASSVLGGYLLQHTGNDWNLFISVLAGVYFLGILCWPFIDSETPLLEAAAPVSIPNQRFIRSSATRA